VNAPSGRMVRMAAPLRAAVQRSALVLLIGAALALMVIGKVDEDLARRVRLIATDVAAPLLAVLAEPVAVGRGAVAEARALLLLREENLRLAAEVERLSQWQAVARRLEQENRSYRELLNFVEEPAPSFVSARLIAEAGGPFVRAAIVASGRHDGVLRGQAVVTSDGLVGHVVEVGERASRILLLTDLNSRIPVRLESSRFRAILTGDNTETLRLLFLPGNAEIAVGERVVTSGHGGLLPPGIPIGVIGAIDDAGAVVVPFVDGERLEFVRILRFEPPRLAPGIARALGETAASGD